MNIYPESCGEFHFGKLEFHCGKLHEKGKCKYFVDDKYFKYIPKWISVKEKLPPLEQEVLIFAYNREIHVAEFCNFSGCEDWHITSQKYVYCQDELNIKRENVTHWMPLPEPPEDK